MEMKGSGVSMKGQLYHEEGVSQAIAISKRGICLYGVKAECQRGQEPKGVPRMMLSGSHLCLACCDPSSICELLMSRNVIA